MTRLHALVEGQTEEAFFNRCIVGYLAARGIYSDVRVINPKSHSNLRSLKGGWSSFSSANRDLSRWMKEDTGAWFTSMVDLYAIPKDFPKILEAEAILDPYQRVKFLEDAWQSVPANHCTA